MRVLGKVAWVLALGVAAAGLGAVPAGAQVVPPAAVPVIVDTAAPIVVNAVKPKPKNVGLGKFEGYVQNANIVQITVRAKGNETSLQTFTLSKEMSQKMQTIVDRGGFQYGDKVTIYYDPQTKQAMNLKGKPSRPI
jgi:hypothetical protein